MSTRQISTAQKLHSNGDIRETHETMGWPIFRLAFRPFFLLGALFSTINLLIWSITYSGVIQFSPYGGSYFWHSHEMLFGFVAAIIVGFLLTAVQTWTKVPSIKGRTLAVLVIIWFLGRLFLAFPQWFNDYFIAFVDIAFLPLAAVFFARPIIKAKVWRNLIFIPILLGMTLLNSMMHASVLGVGEFSFQLSSISHTMVLLISLVMCIIGGRVFPMFTANGTQTPRVTPIIWLERSSVFLIIVSIIMSLKIVELPDFILGIGYISAGVINFIRAIRWRIWVTLTTPLVWPLHISYWAMALGLIFLGLVEIQLLTSTSLALHTITVGGMGLMILSMISRVSLGHTGRPIKVSYLMTMAFLMMVIAFLIRVLFPLFYNDYTMVIITSAVFWAFAYGLFLITYCPILFKPRIDGAPG